MELVDSPNNIEIIRHNIRDIYDELLHVAQQLESLNEELGKYELNNIGTSILAESMRGLSKQILDYDDNVLKRLDKLFTPDEWI